MTTDPGVATARTRWLLPRSQTEYPARPVLAEATVHARREVTFLVLAAIALVGTCALVLLGTSRSVDAAALLAGVGLEVELPTALRIPLGAVAFAPTFVALALVAELFGRRRAVALYAAGLAACAALAGMLRLADVIDGGDAAGGALATSAAVAVAHGLFLLACELLRERGVIVRANVASLIAQIGGWSAFAVVLHASRGVLVADLPAATIAALGAGAVACSVASVLVLSLPAALIARALRVALRVGPDVLAPHARSDDAPADVHADDALAWRSAAPAPAFTRTRPPAVIVGEDDDARPPFSSGEMRFFRDGDALAE